jgi:ribose-phosphate pyrophosphokinase
MSIHPLRIFSGSAHPELAAEVASILGLHVGKSTTRHLPDSEVHVMIDEVVRDQDIFLIQPCSVPVNDNLVEVLLFLDAFRRASAHSVSLVIPYFPYARQDRMARGREAISARVVADLLESQGAARVVYVDIHNRATQGFFKIPIDPLTALPLLAEYFRRPAFANAAIVSPDVGRAGMAGRYAERLNLPLVIMQKRRTSFPAETTLWSAISPVTDHHRRFDGRRQRPEATRCLYSQAPKEKPTLRTHAVLLPSALRPSTRMSASRNGDNQHHPLPPEKCHPKSRPFSRRYADIISRIHQGVSISEKLILA